ncbi:MAG: DUF167 domain-containing protein [Gemmatimonadota bacterium]
MRRTGDQRAAPGGRQPSATVTVRVQPRAPRDGVSGLSGGVLRVRLTAPPVENRANEALVRYLAGTLGVPRRCVEIVAGDRGRDKIVRVLGIAPAELYGRLGLKEPAD